MNCDRDVREMADSIQDNSPLSGVGTSGGAPRLLQLASLAEKLGAEPVAEEARELAGRVAEGHFYLASVGQFKRGKSTLLNAPVDLNHSAETVKQLHSERDQPLLRPDGRTASTASDPSSPA